jgi:hypothetical protein
MTDAFTAAKLIRKRRTKWWREHIPLAYAAVISFFVVIYIAVAFIDRNAPRWLRVLGVTPSGVNLLLGTAYCGLGIWGLKDARGIGTVWIVLYVLCLLGGILNLLKAFGFI